MIGGVKPPKRNKQVTDRPQKITLGEMRASGVRGVLIYCADYKCGHWIKINADQWPDDVRLSDLDDKFICTACGLTEAKHGLRTPQPLTAQGRARTDPMAEPFGAKGLIRKYAANYRDAIQLLAGALAAAAGGCIVPSRAPCITFGAFDAT